MELKHILITLVIINLIVFLSGYLNDKHAEVMVDKGCYPIEKTFSRDWECPRKEKLND